MPRSTMLGHALELLFIGATMACAAPRGAPPAETPQPKVQPTPAPATSPAASRPPAGTSDEEAAAALACAERQIERFNEENPDDDVEVLLFEAARCYQHAGKLAHAAKVLHVMLDNHPGPHAAEGHEQLLALYHAMQAREGALTTPRGLRCLNGVDPRALANVLVAELMDATACLYDEALVGTALALQQEVARRVLSAEQRTTNEEWIAKLERGLAGLARRSEAIAAEPPPEPEPEPKPADDPAAVPRVTDAGPPTLPLASPVPDFATLSFRTRKRLRLRANVVDVGAAYAPRSLGRIDVEGRPYSVFMAVPVLDADAQGTPRRPRVICEDDEVRLGLALDTSSLATVVRERTFVSPTQRRPRKVGAKTPGLRLAGGTTVGQTSQAEGGTVEIAYRGLFLEAQGFVPADALDVVYAPEEIADDDVRNGKLRGNVRFLDAPGGNEFARTNRDSTTRNEMHVLTLGPDRGGYTLVRYQESDGFVVGWIPSEDVERYKKKKWGMGYGSGSGSIGSTNAVKLPRGTLLVAPGSAEIVGVVKTTSNHWCGSTCADPIPKLQLRACAHPIDVYAITPEVARTQH